jgi:hypothetical protein
MFYLGKHAFISYAKRTDLEIIKECCQSFAFDNGAFTFWKGDSKKQVDWKPYYKWVEENLQHPGFDFAIIPDVIDGSENENDRLLREWSKRFDKQIGVPVYHIHESLTRLTRLVEEWPRVALGSSGEYSTPGTDKWWARMSIIMNEICSEGLPSSKLHGLRMLNPDVFKWLPLSSADSTNAARNGSFDKISPIFGSDLIARRTEMINSAQSWDSQAASRFHRFKYK